MLSSAATLSSVRAQLAKEEAAEMSGGTIYVHELTQSAFLQVGLELEEQQ